MSARILDETLDERTHADHTVAQELLDERDLTAQRLARATPVDRTAALAWLGMKHPDLVHEALDEIGADQ